MSDEPRRSGRGNKGQHTRNVESEPSPDPSKPKPKGKSKTAKKKYPDEGGVIDDDGEWIRCPCGKNEEDEEERQMVCCDNCKAWEHNECVGLPDQEYKGDHYFCERCDPDSHHDLLLSMNQGSWQTFVEQRKEENKKPKGRPGKKGKGAQQSAGPNARKVESPAPPAEANKRKLQAEEGPNGDSQSSKGHQSSGQTLKAEENATKKRKTSAPAKQDEKPVPVANSIAELAETSRNKIAAELRKKFTDLIRIVSKRNSYRIPDAHTTESLGERIALLVEDAMFRNFAGSPPSYTGQYKGKFLQINSNIAKNEPLFMRLLDGSISPDEFSQMSSDQMASEELQQQVAAMKQEVDKQSILQQEDGPRIRRTHKGEELVDDQSQSIATESMMSGPAPRRRESAMDETANSPTTGQAQSPSATEYPVDSHKPPTGSPKLERSSSSNFNIRDVWDNVGSPDTDQTPFVAPQPRASNFNQSASIIRTNQHDAEIDRLLDEDGGDSAPYSPSEFESAVVWRGTIDMPVNDKSSVAKFTAAARQVAGGDVSGRVSVSSIFPESIVLAGRIKPELADQYVAGLSSASNTDVTVFALDVAAVGDNAAKGEWDKLFDYLSSRERYGVIKSYRDFIRDIYLVPLEAGAEKTPLFLARLKDNDIEQPRPSRLLLLTFIFKWSGDRSTPQSAQATPTTGGQSGAQLSQQIPSAGSAMSPIGNDSDFARQPQPFPLPSTTLPQGYANQQSGNLPSNPYITGGTSAYSPAASTAAYNQAQIDNFALARQILGPLTETPVAKQILEQADSVQVESLQNLKYIFDTHPEARENFEAFQQALASQGSEGGR